MSANAAFVAGMAFGALVVAFIWAAVASIESFDEDSL